jgi:hypothetical protein
MASDREARTDGWRLPELVGELPDPADRALLAHLRTFFAGHRVDVLTGPPGPLDHRIEGFHLVRIAPGPRLPLWTFASLGCWRATQEDGHGIELLLAGRSDDPRLAELVGISAYFHAGPTAQRLDIGRTLDIGEPWFPGSGCDHLLVSVPYPYGPDLEIAELPDGHARLLWLLPITEAEARHLHEHGLESLERALEEAAVDIVDPNRASAV